MTIYTIGFTQKSAETFFETIKKNDIQHIIDVRLNNKSQLAGFAKGRDLEYFLLRLCNTTYGHELQFAPTKEILNAYKKGMISWEEYERSFDDLMSQRRVVELFEKKYLNYNNVCLLCSESTPENCHRRLLADNLSAELDLDIVHL